LSAILKALAVGTLSLVVRRLGISLILFAYLAAAHSKQFAAIEHPNGTIAPELWLAAVVIVLGIVIVAFRSAFSHYSLVLDGKALPRLDQLTLLHINRGDLSISTLHSKSRALFDCAKASLLWLLLTLLCLAVAPALGLVLVVLFAAAVLLSVFLVKPVTPGAPVTWKSTLLTQPDNFVEIVLVAGLIIGFLLVTPQGGLISGTLMILMIARFGSALRTLAVNIVRLKRLHETDKKLWRSRTASWRGVDSPAKAAANLPPGQAKTAA
jgi:hypothetical protein